MEGEGLGDSSDDMPLPKPPGLVFPQLVKHTCAVFQREMLCMRALALCLFNDDNAEDSAPLSDRGTELRFNI